MEQPRFRIQHGKVLDTETGAALPRLRTRARAGSQPYAAFAHYLRDHEAPVIVCVYLTRQGLCWRFSGRQAR